MSHRSLSFISLLIFFGFGSVALSNEINGLKLNEEMDFLKRQSQQVHTWILPEKKEVTLKQRKANKIKTIKEVQKTQENKENEKPSPIKKKKVRSDQIALTLSGIKKETVKPKTGPFLNSPINNYIPEEILIKKRRRRSR